MNTLEALVALNMAGNVGSARLGRLVEAFGSPEKALSAGRDRLLAVEGIGERIASDIAGFDCRRITGELLSARAAGVRVTSVYDDDYPRLLRSIFDPPPVLYVKGELLPEDNLALAVVGSRRPSFYGLSAARSFSERLALNGVTVVSGMARGIDTQAHNGALARGGRTIAVMGSGFNRLYPPENARLSERISESGCVLSEFPMDYGPSRTSFPRRNRVISGLSLGTLVVEAARNSGALITADFALEQGRDVFAVPGPFDSRCSAGANALIQQGAKLVTCVDDILEEFSFVPSSESREEGFKKPVDGERELLYDIISGDGASFDEIAKRTGMGICRLSGLLLKMQLERIIKRAPGNRFLRNQQKA